VVVGNAYSDIVTAGLKFTTRAGLVNFSPALVVKDKPALTDIFVSGFIMSLSRISSSLDEIRFAQKIAMV